MIPEGKGIPEQNSNCFFFRSYKIVTASASALRDVRDIRAVGAVRAVRAVRGTRAVRAVRASADAAADVPHALDVGRQIGQGSNERYLVPRPFPIEGRRVFSVLGSS